MIRHLMILWFLILNLVQIRRTNPIVFRDEVHSLENPGFNVTSGFNRSHSSRRIDQRTDQRNGQTLALGSHSENGRSTTTETLRWPNGKIASSSPPNLSYMNSNFGRNEEDPQVMFAAHNLTKPLVFPSQKPKLLLPDIDDNGLPRCVNSPSDTFCERVEAYPRIDLRNEYGLDIEEFRDVFGVKGIDARKSYIDDDYFGERVCDGSRKIIYPKMAKNQAKRWVYIVNDDSDFRQHVVTEICRKASSPCAYLEGNLPPGVSSHCRQKYAYVRLLALHPTEQRTYTDIFQFPSCCTCYIKNPFYGTNKPDN